MAAARSLSRSGQHRAAIAAFAQVIELRPDHWEAYLELGFVMHSLAERDTARSWYLMALAQAASPASHLIEVQLGGVCLEMGLPGEAETWFLRALQSSFLSALDCFRAGSGLARLGRISEASSALERSVATSPTAIAWTELGFCRFRQGDIQAAEASYRNALDCDPNYAAAHANLALVLLYRGEYRAGFAKYEWRLKLDSYFKTVGFKAPRWTGEPLDGKTILLHAEQGYGDTLQFLRYIPLVAALGAKVLLIVQPALNRLVRQYPGVAQCLQPQDDASGVAFHCPLMSLPFVFGTDEKTIPPVDPSALLGCANLPCSPQQAHDTPEQLRPLQVGLVWAGNRGHISDAERSVPLTRFEALGGCALAGGRGITFLSLQHGPAAREIAHASLPFPLHDHSSEVKDFADTAHIVSRLDLVITVDTAVAHLAASLGKPVWVLLGSVPEWRWGAISETTPWYPAVRLFRWEAESGWEGVFERVAEALTKLLEQTPA
jgi:tetratricopeptide (TPR) repeat protein